MINYGCIIEIQFCINSEDEKLLTRFRKENPDWLLSTLFTRNQVKELFDHYLDPRIDPGDEKRYHCRFVNIKDIKRMDSLQGFR